MIRSFADRRTRDVAEGRQPRALPNAILKTARRKLGFLNAATSLEALKVPPGNRLHPLGRDRAGQHAIWINDQYRICFVWHDGDADHVEIMDYH